MQHSPSSIERREYKYLIDRSVAEQVRKAIAPFCQLDHYSAISTDHRYTIESLYFDTQSLTLYKANEQELLDRFKLRVRGYPDNPGSPVFFEVKRRVHDAIIKTRGAVTGDWGAMLSDPFSTNPQLAKAPVQRFFSIHHNIRARPLTLVRYRREAWASQIDDYARVTFDNEIASQPAQDYTHGSTPHHWRAQDGALAQQAARSSVVLELKFQNMAPIWMSSMVQTLNLWRRAFSKYCTSVRAWHMRPVSRTEAI